MSKSPRKLFSGYLGPRAKQRTASSAYSLVTKNSGFTLIELIVVITILGILITVLIAILNPFAQIQKGHDAQRKSDIKTIQNALEAYYNDNGSYPANGSTGGSTGVNSKQLAPWIPGLNTNYISVIPGDPKNTAYLGSPWDSINGPKTYSYVYWSGDYCGLKAGQFYLLYAHMELASDPSAGNTVTVPGCSHPETVYSGWRTVTNP